MSYFVVRNHECIRFNEINYPGYGGETPLRDCNLWRVRKSPFTAVFFLELCDFLSAKDRNLRPVCDGVRSQTGAVNGFLNDVDRSTDKFAA